MPLESLLTLVLLQEYKVRILNVSVFPVTVQSLLIDRNVKQEVELTPGRERLVVLVRCNVVTLNVSVNVTLFI
jgi:hypothetical protein